MSYIDEILKIIQDSKEILILTKANASIDEEIASLITANFLQRLSDSKSISYKFDKSKYSEINFIEELYKNIGIVKEDFPSNFVFEIENSDNKIKNIEWKNQDGKINFYITTKNSKQINKNDLKFIKKDKEIDLIITIGINTYDEIGTLAKTNLALFEKAKIVSIKRDNLDSNIKSFNIIDDKASSYSEIAYEISQRFKININKNEADMLLLGIYIATDNFQKVTNPKTFSIASSLLALNADTEFANKYKAILQNTTIARKDKALQISSKSTNKVNKFVNKKQDLSTKQVLDNKQDLKNKQTSVKKAENKTEKQEATRILVKDEKTNEIEDNNNLQIPLQKANALPTVEVNSSTQPNYIAPPPINPVKQNSFNMPLNPKLR